MLISKSWQALLTVWIIRFEALLNACYIALVRNKVERSDLMRISNDGIYMILDSPFDFSIK